MLTRAEEGSYFSPVPQQRHGASGQLGCVCPSEFLLGQVQLRSRTLGSEAAVSGLKKWPRRSAPDTEQEGPAHRPALGPALVGLP